MHDDVNRKDAAAPVSSDSAGKMDLRSAQAAPFNRFRANIEAKLARLRGIRNPTVEEIEMKLFWEAYLASPEPVPRALQTNVSEPVQKY